MEIHTIGFTKKTAEQFFTLLKDAGIGRLMDVRLNNVSQLAGFAKREDLRYFLREICSCEYLHEPLFAPTQEMLDTYKKKKGSWDEYERQFLELLAARRVEEKIDPSVFSVPTALLCSEPTPERCHRRLVLDYLHTKWSNISVRHL
ncbi:MAG TPA: DUF488 domain-containing protein [Candidatus Acidoferrum sp.]|jgi:uncharacterized protein (DUF488 family)